MIPMVVIRNPTIPRWDRSLTMITSEAIPVPIAP